MVGLEWVKTKNHLKPNSMNSNNNSGNQQSNITPSSNKKKMYIVVPYTKGLSESLKNSCGKNWIQMYFEGGKTMKNLPVAPIDKDPITK